MARILKYLGTVISRNQSIASRTYSILVMAIPQNSITQTEQSAQASSLSVGPVDSSEKINAMGAVSSPETRDISPTSPIKPSKKATIAEMKANLAQQGLDTKGKKETLWRRLMNAFTALTIGETPTKTETPAEEPEPEIRPWEGQKWESFLCFDVEATCRGGREFDWPNEIIEFPVVLVRWVDETPEAESSSATTRPKRKRLEKIDTFHSYVRPTWKPKLSDFCVQLTGITQERVEASPTFPEMIVDLEKWLRKHDLLDDGDDPGLKSGLWVTDGPWDLRDFVAKQLHITPLSPNPFPRYFTGHYLNIKQATQTVLAETWRRERLPERQKEARITTAKLMRREFREKSDAPNFYYPIAGQIKAFGLGDFEGRQHSGIDDATNVARILIAMSERDVLLEPNGWLHSGERAKKWLWQGKPGEVKFEEWMSVQKGWFPEGKEVKDEVTGEGTGEIPEARSEEKGEWVMKEDAMGRLKAVREVTPVV